MALFLLLMFIALDVAALRGWVTDSRDPRFSLRLNIPRPPEDPGRPQDEIGLAAVDTIAA